MEILLNWTVSLAFAFVFAILGVFIIFLHIPKEERFKYYRYSRYTLGIGFLILTVYCCIHPLTMQGSDYIEFCFMLFFSLLVSWLTYSAFLFVVYAESFKRRRFFLDGIIPISIMLVLGIVGMKFPQFQKINTVLFGIIFGTKCLWMGYTCIREYRRCTKDLENYYDNTPDLKWMYNLIWLSIILSISTIVAFYIKSLEFVYYLFLLAIYSYMTFKMVNYLPIKISRLRETSVEQTAETENKSEKIGKDLKSKLENLVNSWVEEKKFTKPGITIKDVAAEIGTNHNYLSRYLNSVVGMTFSVWLHTLRIEESKMLLSNPDRISIEEIGRKVGIPEIYNYSRWFKNITGMTPQQYRKSVK